MKLNEVQELEIIENEDAIDFFDDDDFEPVVWENPDWSEFAGWRDLV